MIRYGLMARRRHDQPLAVIGVTAGRYVGVWSHRAGREPSGDPGPLVVERITVANLGDMVHTAAAEVGEPGSRHGLG